MATSTYPSAPPMHHKFMTVVIADVSIASSNWIVPGFRGRIRKIHSVIDTAITVADAAITVEIGGVAVTGAALTIESTSSAAGDIASATVPFGSTNTFGPTDALEVITDGGSTTTSKCTITLELEPV